MNKKKLLILIVLSIFVVGMVMGTASASYTFKDKGYKYKMSTKEVKKLKKQSRSGYYGSKHVKVSKKVKRDSMEKVTKKQFIKSQKQGINSKKYKFISCKKLNDGFYKVTLKKTAHMNCKVKYYNGQYYFSAKAY